MFDLGASRSNDCVCTSSCQLTKKILRQARPTATVSSMAHGSWAADYAPAPIHQVIARAGSGVAAVAVIELRRGIRRMKLISIARDVWDSEQGTNASKWVLIL